MKVLVTFAVEAEFAPWRRLRRFRRSARTGVSSYEATLAETKIEVVLTGIGKAACEGAFIAIGFLEGREPDFVISSGLAGALRSGLSPGDLVAPRRARTL